MVAWVGGTRARAHMCCVCVCLCAGQEAEKFEKSSHVAASCREYIHYSIACAVYVRVHAVYVQYVFIVVYASMCVL